MIRGESAFRLFQTLSQQGKRKAPTQAPHSPLPLPAFVPPSSSPFHDDFFLDGRSWGNGRGKGQGMGQGGGLALALVEVNRVTCSKNTIVHRSSCIQQL